MTHIFKCSIRLSVLLGLVFFSGRLYSQGDLYEYKYFFEQHLPKYQDWLISQNLDDIFRAEKISIEDNKLTVYLKSNFITDDSLKSAIYLGIIFQRLGKDIQEIIKPDEHKQEASIPLNFPRILIWLIPLHCIILIGIISLKAFTVITFQDMNLFLSGVESCFGIYMGGVLINLYDVNVGK